MLIIPGLPGTGMSTIAHLLAQRGCIHIEANMYFHRDGVYSYDQSCIGEAQSRCLCRTSELLAADHNVIVANTCIKPYQYASYLAVARSLSINAYIIAAYGNYQSIHDVPLETIEKMHTNWQDDHNEIVQAEIPV